MYSLVYLDFGLQSNITLQQIPDTSFACIAAWVLVNFTSLWQSHHVLIPDMPQSVPDV